MGRSSGCLLELDERGVLAQVKSEQHGVSDLQAHASEVALGLLRLDAAEGGELRLALRDIQDGLGTLLANVVVKQTVSKGAIMSSRGIDSKARGVGRILELLEGGVGGDDVRHDLCALVSNILALKAVNAG